MEGFSQPQCVRRRALIRQKSRHLSDLIIAFHSHMQFDAFNTSAMSFNQVEVILVQASPHRDLYRQT